MKGNHIPPSSNRLLPSNNYNRCSKCGNTTHWEGFTCPAKKYQCKVCHKFGHFTGQCFQKKHYPQHRVRQSKAHQIQVDESHNHLENYSSDVSLSEDSFCLQVRVRKWTKGTQKLPNATRLITNIAYRLKPHHTRNQYLRARIDTGAEVNLMPISVYRLIHHNCDLKKLMPLSMVLSLLCGMFNFNCNYKLSLQYQAITWLPMAAKHSQPMKRTIIPPNWNSWC